MAHRQTSSLLGKRGADDRQVLELLLSGHSPLFELEEGRPSGEALPPVLPLGQQREAVSGLLALDEVHLLVPVLGGPQGPAREDTTTLLPHHLELERSRNGLLCHREVALEPSILFVDCLHLSLRLPQLLGHTASLLVPSVVEETTPGAEEADTQLRPCLAEKVSTDELTVSQLELAFTALLGDLHPGLEGSSPQLGASGLAHPLRDEGSNTLLLVLQLDIFIHHLLVESDEIFDHVLELHEIGRSPDTLFWCQRAPVMQAATATARRRP